MSGYRIGCVLWIVTMGVYGCGDEDREFGRISCGDVTGTCVEVGSGDSQRLLEVVNQLTDSTTIVLAKGIYELTNQVTIRNANHVTLTGQGIDETILSFAKQQAQSNGVDVMGNHFEISHLTIEDAKKDGIRVEESDYVTFAHIKVTWSRGPMSENGAYGIYPVRSRHVLIEHCEAYNASDAGIYVGQVQHAILRHNIARQNVAGLEIENTQYAEVHDNLVEDNTGGLLVFDLPGNPIMGRDIRVHHNIVRANNRENFAPGGTVSAIPAGTGTFLLASRRVEIHDNVYHDNNTVAVAVLSGLTLQSADAWRIAEDKLTGDVEGLKVSRDEGGDYFNFRTSDIYVHDNQFVGGGTSPDGSDIENRPLGFLLYFIYKLQRQSTDHVIYDTIGESAFNPEDGSANSNDNALCLARNTGATFASLNLEALESSPDLSLVYRPAPPFAPFDCDTMDGGSLQKPDLGEMR